ARQTRCARSRGERWPFVQLAEAYSAPGGANVFGTADEGDGPALVPALHSGYNPASNAATNARALARQHRLAGRAEVAPGATPIVRRALQPDSPRARVSDAE